MSSLIEGKWNHAVSSSMDRTIKVWDMSTIVQEAHPLARHTNPVLDLLSCETLGVAVARTRSCLGVWDLRTGRLHSTFARDSVGAKVVPHDETPAGHCLCLLCRSRPRPPCGPR